jgi:uncharacterized protein (TIGR00661 family)
MTQALALAGILRTAGHTVAAALVGRSGRRDLPAFFLEKIGAPLHQFDSPNFITDAKEKGIRLLSSLTYTVRHAGRYMQSLEVIGSCLDRYKPDLVVNFYEPLAGVYYKRHSPAAPMVCIGHQYLCHHPAFLFPEGQRIDRWALRWFTDLTAWGAARRLALSFTPYDAAPGKRPIQVMPPLLRKAVLEQSRPAKESFFLAYVLNSGYAEEIIRWHDKHPEVELHCFWDNRTAPEELSHDETLTFHRLSDEKFVTMMARCRGLICTAGFESVCEAMYLSRPVLMVPVKGHYEQHCNALDAVRAGAGVSAPSFDIDLLVEHLPQYRDPSQTFCRWVEDAAQLFLEELELVVKKTAHEPATAHA